MTAEARGAHLALAREVLEFWFGPRESPDFGRHREAWWVKDPAFDAEIRERFAKAHRLAAEGRLDGLLDDASGCLALILLLDQFSRHIYRGDARAYAADARARAAARHALERGYDRGRLPVERLFFYLPFEHSEDVADQRRSVALFRSLPPDAQHEKALASALRHLEIVERFGRFPHRNAVLGRPATPEEQAFLEEPDSSF